MASEESDSKLAAEKVPTDSLKTGVKAGKKSSPFGDTSNSADRNGESRESHDDGTDPKENNLDESEASDEMDHDEQGGNGDWTVLDSVGDAEENEVEGSHGSCEESMDNAPNRSDGLADESDDVPEKSTAKEFDVDESSTSLGQSEDDVNQNKDSSHLPSGEESAGGGCSNDKPMETDISPSVVPIRLSEGPGNVDLSDTVRAPVDSGAFCDESPMEVDKDEQVVPAEDERNSETVATGQEEECTSEKTTRDNGDTIKQSSKESPAEDISEPALTEDSVPDKDVLSAASPVSKESEQQEEKHSEDTTEADANDSLQEGATENTEEPKAKVKQLDIPEDKSDEAQGSPKEDSGEASITADLQEDSTDKDKNLAKETIKEEPAQQKMEESKDTKEAQDESSETSGKDGDVTSDEKKEDVEKDKGDDKTVTGADEEKERKQKEAEMKGYITDTMNELLGLFGYDKVDDSMKDKLELGKIGAPASEGGASAAKSSKTDSSTPTNSDSSKTENSTSSTTDSAKKGQASGRSCAECGVTKGLKFQVVFQGKTRFLCSDSCFKVFRGKQNLAPPPAVVPGRKSAAGHVAENCFVCKKEIKNGLGYLPLTGENKPLCSEDCMQNFQQLHGPKQVCAQCQNNIPTNEKCLTWETMEFCNEDCLGKYQSFLGSHCACCQAAVQRSSLGKYCVRFGADIRQFCSGRCLEEFKKGLKVCSFCQKDLSQGQEGFLAPVGDKGQFKDFCSQQCMERYETMHSTNATTPPSHQCSVCSKTVPAKVQVKYDGKTHALCSDPCIAAFRYANKINTSICDTCHKFFEVEAAQTFTLQFEGTRKRFCSKGCINLFVLSHRKIVPCTWCKVKKYNFDMIERVDSNNHVQLFCSLNCLSLFRVSLNATSSRSVRCDNCHKMMPAQYHLTMSDASIRNFCTYQCVIHFQSQFTNVPTLTTSTPSVRQGTSSQGTPNQTGTPVISSVMSLAPKQSKPSPVGQPVVATMASVATTVSQPNTAPQKTPQPTRQQPQPPPPPMPTISGKVPPKPSTPTTQTTTSTLQTALTAGTHIVREVIIKPPPPKQQKNKALLCKPIMQTKGVSCRPHPCHKGSQTEGEVDKEPVLMPIPIPIFVPVPLHMYSQPAPFPVPFPIPLPVPIFIPTTKKSAGQILKHIKVIQEKIPDNPFEAELLMMAEMVAEDEEETKEEQSVKKEEPCEEAVNNLDIEEDAKDDLADTVTPASMLDVLLHEPSVEDEPILDLETALALPIVPPPILDEPDKTPARENGSDIPTPKESRPRHRGRKRASVCDSPGSVGVPEVGLRRSSRKRKKLIEDLPLEEDNSSDLILPDYLDTEEVADVSRVSGTSTPTETGQCLKFMFGVQAWKHWVVQKNAQLERGSQSSRKLKLFKTDILQLTADELNYSLCLFVKEVRKPSGEEYAPDSIYYLCLGIQQFLFENGRIDNIFTDSYYEKFTECLNEVLQRLETVNEGTFLSRIEEEILWEARQLGAHSPHVLLNTLMYFNTKYFLLRSVEDHMHLSFSQIMKHWRKAPTSSRLGVPARSVLLRYYPVQKDFPKKRKEDQALEQVENVDNPLRCPVKLYEFYLSKCPESVKTRSDVFYLYPERSCVPDSPVWYSTQPLGKDSVAKMLQRIRMVRWNDDTRYRRAAEVRL